MKKQATRTQGIKHKIALLLSIAMLFTLVFTGTALAEEVTAYESVNYAELEEFLGNGSPGDNSPFWDHTAPFSHLQLIRNGNTSGISATGVQLLEAGMMMPDGIARSGQPVLCPNRGAAAHRNANNATTRVSFNLRTPTYRGFHGYHTSRQGGGFAESNYVSAFNLITEIANRGGETTGLTNPGLTPGSNGAFFHIRSRFRRTEGVGAAEGMRCGTCDHFLTWQQIMDLHGMTGYRNQNATGQRSFRRHFIWGIALHALSDTFEHSALVTDSAGLWRIVNGSTGNNNTGVQVAVRFASAQTAINLALAVVARPTTHNHRHGCCCKFLVASAHFNGTNFRMANLTRYVYQSRRAVNNLGLTGAQLTQLRTGDAAVLVNIDPTNDTRAWAPIFSLSQPYES